MPRSRETKTEVQDALASTGQFSAAEYDWFKSRHMKRGTKEVSAEMIIFPYFFFTQLWPVEEDDL